MLKIKSLDDFPSYDDHLLTSNEYTVIKVNVKKA